LTRKPLPNPPCCPRNGGSSDRAIVDLERGDYEELDQLNAANHHAETAYRINRPQDIGIAWAIRSGSASDLTS
jgi:hypothetical protein